MKSFYPKNLPLVPKLTWLAIQLLLVGLGYYLYVYKFYWSKPWMEYTGLMFVVFGVLFFCLTFTPSIKGKDTFTQYLILAPMIIVVCLAILGCFQKQRQYKFEKIDTYAVASVIKFESEFNVFSMEMEYYAIIMFRHEKALIRQRIDDTGYYDYKDPVEIMYSSEIPEILMTQYDYDQGTRIW